MLYMMEQLATIDEKEWEFHDVPPNKLLKYVSNNPLYIEGESPSANISATARGLAKLGAFMANKGTFKGQ